MAKTSVNSNMGALVALALLSSDRHAREVVRPVKPDPEPLNSAIKNEAERVRIKGYEESVPRNRKERRAMKKGK